MGNSFHFAFEFYYGSYAVENYWNNWRASAFCARRPETNLWFYSTLSPVRHQPSDWLQMGRAVSPGWCARLGQSVATTPPLAAPHSGAVVARAATTPPTASPLGCSEDSRSLAALLPTRTFARSSHPGQMGWQALASAAPDALAPGTDGDTPAIDATHPPQRSLDRRFQGMVSHVRWQPVLSDRKSVV